LFVNLQLPFNHLPNTLPAKADANGGFIFAGRVVARPSNAEPPPLFDVNRDSETECSTRGWWMTGGLVLPRSPAASFPTGFNVSRL
jgi:hypothetical protein